MKRLVSSVIWLILLAGACGAQVNFSVFADRTSLALGEQFMVTARVVSPRQLASHPLPQMPPSDDFAVLRTSQDQSSSTSIQVINGRMAQTVEITYLTYYVIQPKKEGTFQFPSLSITINGQAYASQPFAVSVGKGEVVPANDVSVRLLIDKKDLWVGEQTRLTLQVSKKINSPAALTNEGYSACAGMLIKALGTTCAVIQLTKEVKGRQEQMSGELYAVFRAYYSLIPTTAGDIAIPPLPFEYIIQKRVQNQRRVDPFFGGFFGDDFFGPSVQQIPKSTMSNGLTIHAKSLPPAPAGFSGAVGHCGFSCSADPTSVPAGEAVTLKIEVRGNTRPNSLGEIRLPPMENIEIFTPEKHVFSDTSEAAGINSRKSWNYMLIPQQEGAAAIPAISYVYFDPDAGEYKTLSSIPTALEVTKGSGARPQSGARYLTQAEIREVGSDIRYIKTPRSLAMRTDRPYRNPLFLILYPVPFLSVLFAGLYRLQSTRRKDAALMLRQKAVRNAYRGIDAVRKNAARLLPADFLGRCAGVIETYITHKFGFAAAGKTLDEIKDELARRTISEALRTALTDFMQTLDGYRFGGATLDESARARVLAETGELVERIEKASRKEKRP